MNLSAGLSISKKLYAILILLAAATVSCAALAISASRQQQRLAEDVGAAYRGALYVEKINGLVYAVVMESRGVYMSADIAGARKFAQNLLGFNGRVEQVVAEWRSHLHPDDTQEFEAFAARIGQFVAFRRELARLGMEVSPAAARQWGDNDANRSVRSALNRDLETLAELYSKRLVRHVDELNRSSAQTTRRARWLAALALALIAAGILLVRRSIVRPLSEITQVTARVATGTRDVVIPHAARRDEIGALARSIGVFQQALQELVQLGFSVRKAGIQVGNSVTEIADTSSHQLAMASEIAATTTEIGATSREISATSQELARSMREVVAVAEQSAATAGSSQAGLAQMEEAMRGVMEACAAMNNRLGVLSEKAAGITQVVTTITKVADQTNLLSLNAAIEAEKAGEYGRGFSVVATEIRRLADQTGVATHDIGQMAGDIQSAISAGVMGMDKFAEEVRRGLRSVQDVGRRLSEIIGQVQTLAPRFEAVNEGVQAQATGAGQITEALSQLGTASQQSVESLRKSNRAIEMLRQVASELRSNVSRFAPGSPGETA